MKIVSNLTCSVDQVSTWVEPRGIINALLHEVAPGQFVHVQLGSAGLTIHHGNDSVGIPLQALLDLAVAHEPRLAPKAPVAQPPANPPKK